MAATQLLILQLLGATSTQKEAYDTQCTISAQELFLLETEDLDPRVHFIPNPAFRIRLGLVRPSCLPSGTALCLAPVTDPLDLLTGRLAGGKGPRPRPDQDGAVYDRGGPDLRRRLGLDGTSLSLPLGSSSLPTR